MCRHEQPHPPVARTGCESEEPAKGEAMIEQTASTLNLSSEADEEVLTDAARETGPGVMVASVPQAANENDAALDATRLAAEALAREKARLARQQERARERRRWLLLLAGVLTLAVALKVFAAQVVRLVPGMAHAYHAVGMQVPLPGFEVRSLRVRWVRNEEGVPELLVSGQVLNDTRQAQRMPRIKLALLDDAGAVIYRWRISARQASTLQPGAQARFRSRLADVPEEAALVRVVVSPTRQ